MSDETKHDYSIPAAARVIGCAPNTIKAWITTGKIRAYKMGGNGNYRIPCAELDRVRSEWSVKPDISTAL